MPLGSVPVVIVSAAGLMVMLTVPVAVPAGLAESVAFTVSVEVPAVVGMPVTAQFAPIDRPAGSVPDVMVQVYGDVPPLTPTVAEYAVPTVPFGRLPVVMVTEVVPDATVIVNALVPVALFASFAWAVKVNVPLAVGVPLMVPLLASVSPAGNAPEATLNVYGPVPPLAVRAVV